MIFYSHHKFALGAFAFVLSISDLYVIEGYIRALALRKNQPKMMQFSLLKKGHPKVWVRRHTKIRGEKGRGRFGVRMMSRFQRLRSRRQYKSFKRCRGWRDGWDGYLFQGGDGGIW